MDKLLLFRIIAISLGFIAAMFGVINELRLKKAGDEDRRTIKRNKNIGYATAIFFIFLAFVLKYFWVEAN